MEELKKHGTLGLAAARAGLDRKTGAKYRDAQRLRKASTEGRRERLSNATSRYTFTTAPPMRSFFSPKSTCRCRPGAVSTRTLAAAAASRRFFSIARCTVRTLPSTPPRPPRRSTGHTPDLLLGRVATTQVAPNRVSRDAPLARPALRAPPGVCQHPHLPAHGLLRHRHLRSSGRHIRPLHRCLLFEAPRGSVFLSPSTTGSRAVVAGGGGTLGASPSGSPEMLGVAYQEAHAGFMGLRRDGRHLRHSTTAAVLNTELLVTARPTRRRPGPQFVESAPAAGQPDLGSPPPGELSPWRFPAQS
jgi:hypothetical protein